MYCEKILWTIKQEQRTCSGMCCLHTSVSLYLSIFVSLRKQSWDEDDPCFFFHEHSLYFTGVLKIWSTTQIFGHYPLENHPLNAVLYAALWASWFSSESVFDYIVSLLREIKYIMLANVFSLNPGINMWCLKKKQKSCSYCKYQTMSSLFLKYIQQWWQQVFQILKNSDITSNQGMPTIKHKLNTLIFTGMYNWSTHSFSHEHDVKNVVHFYNVLIHEWHKLKPLMKTKATTWNNEDHENKHWN